MPFIGNVAAAELHLIFQQDGQFVENVFHSSRTAGWTEPDLETFANNVIAWWLDSMRSHVAPTLSLIRGECISLASETSPGIIIDHAPLPAAGTFSGNALPNNVTVAVRWNTALRGRSFRGRTYHLGLCEEQVTDSHVNPATIATLLSVYGLLMTAVHGAGPGDLSVYSKFHANAPRDHGVLTPINNVSIDPVIDSQRRRLPGRGR